MNYRGLLILVSLWTAGLARVGSRDAFEYKKSKTAIRKEQQSLTLRERLLGRFVTAPTHAPFHTRLFWRFRIYNYALCALGVVLTWIMPQYASVVFWGKMLVADIPLLCYTPFISNWPAKRFDFSRRTRP